MMKITFLVLNVIFLISTTIANEKKQTVEETIKEIEFSKNVRCDFKKSSMAACFGPSQISTCHYTYTYLCSGSGNEFSVKLKIKEFFDYTANERREVVRKVEY